MSAAKKKKTITRKKIVRPLHSVDERSLLVSNILDSVQGAAKPSIINYLSSGQKRLTHIAEEMKGLPLRTLSAELKQLELSALVKRIEVGTMPVIIEYELTSEGYAWNKILAEIYALALAKQSAQK